MNREECENQILEKLKEIYEIAKQYDKSKDFRLTATIYDDALFFNNAYWETDTPLSADTFNNYSEVIQFDN